MLRVDVSGFPVEYREMVLAWYQWNAARLQDVGELVGKVLRRDPISGMDMVSGGYDWGLRVPIFYRGVFSFGTTEFDTSIVVRKKEDSSLFDVSLKVRYEYDCLARFVLLEDALKYALYFMVGRLSVRVNGQSTRGTKSVNERWLASDMPENIWIGEEVEGFVGVGFVGDEVPKAYFVTTSPPYFPEYFSNILVTSFGELNRDLMSGFPEGFFPEVVGVE